MTLHAVVALVAVFLQAASAGVMFFIARAPGWERVRLMAAIALTAGLYSAVDVWFYTVVDDLALRAQLVRVNLFVAALHAAMWMRFTFADASGRIASMPGWTRAVTAGMLALSAVMCAGDLVLDYGRYSHVQVPWLGLDERTYAFNTFGDTVAVVTLSVILLSLAQHVRRTRRGEPGAFGIVVGLTLYALCIVEEALVASGDLPFMYLGSPGYVFAVLPLTIQLLTRFGDDARRLAELSTRLTTEVAARTVERDEARDSLLEQQRLAALGRLAAGVGHEINNPLQYLTFQLEELRSTLSVPAGEAARPPVHAIDDALEGARRIGQVVTSLRTYGVRREHRERVSLTDVVQAALRIASPQVRHDAALVTELAPVPDVLGDEGQLVQMVVNPLVNAAQALASSASPERIVTVRTRTGADGWAELSISDTGPGFAPEVLPRLGEPYVTTRAQRGGTGLGLFVTRGLVDAHGGTVQLGNRTGGGAEVRFRLPPAPAVADHGVAAEPAPATRAGAAHVLVVDDEPELLVAMQRVLERLGHRVTVAADGAAALALARAGAFDVVVSDLMMPRMSGAELAAALAEDAPALRRRFIVMTGGAVTAEDEAFLQREDVVVVNKPVGMQAFGAAIARAMAVPLLVVAVLSACTRGPGAASPAVIAATVPPAGADSVRVERVSASTRLLQLTWLPTGTRPGPWRASVLEVEVAPCVAFRAVKGAPTAVGRGRASALLAARSAAEGAVAAVNADFFAFTPVGVPTGAHVEDGRVVSGPGARPVFMVDSAGGLHLGPLRVTGTVAAGAESVPLTAWNRWPADGLTLLDGAWGVPLDSTADSATVVRAVRLDARRVRVVGAATAPVTASGLVARGDTVLLVAAGSARVADARRLLTARRVGDTLEVAVGLAPVAPREAVGGFPRLLADGRLSPTLATDGAASFRGVNPRTAIGWDRAGRRVWLVVVDGRQPAWSIGTTTRETAELLAALGAHEALNLDGGGSSALAVRDGASGAVRVANRPSDATGERAVGNALVVVDRCGGD